MSFDARAEPARLAQPRALPCACDGKSLDENLRRPLLTRDEPMGKLPEQGVDDLARVRHATLEPGGRVRGLVRYAAQRSSRQAMTPGHPA